MIHDVPHTLSTDIPPHHPLGGAAARDTGDPDGGILRSPWGDGSTRGNTFPAEIVRS